MGGRALTCRTPGHLLIIMFLFCRFRLRLCCLENAMVLLVTTYRTINQSINQFEAAVITHSVTLLFMGFITWKLSSRLILTVRK